MTIRRAESKDAPRVIDLLSQVLEIHAAIRPDFFVPGTTKYSPDELCAILADEKTPVYAAVDEADVVIGYAFCSIRERPSKPYVRPARTLYIDDLCVDEARRGEHIGEALFEHAVAEARRLGCADVTLNVWEGNDAARRFYEAMGMKARATMMELKLSER